MGGDPRFRARFEHEREARAVVSFIPAGSDQAVTVRFVGGTERWWALKRPGGFLYFHLQPNGPRDR
jgi:hypothetical protein